MKKYPKIENKINDVLSGEKQKNALDFVEFLHANEFTLKEYNEYGYGWSVEYKDKGIAFVKIPAEEKELWIWSGGVFGTERTDDDEFNNTIWENVVICPQATCPSKRHCGCEEDIGGTIFGIKFDSTCYSPLGFFDPDVKTLETAKKLLLLKCLPTKEPYD